MKADYIKGLRAALIAICGVCLCSTPLEAQEEKSESSPQPATARPQVAEASGILQEEKQTAEAQNAKRKGDRSDWVSLIPTEGLGQWEVTDFGTEGKVERIEDTIVLGMGDPLTGITWTGDDYPTEDYEIEVKAKRVEGNDFLCGLTFAVGEEFCSFIAGGWGGSLVGLSSVDGFDASENATATTGEFENGTWYAFRVRVDDQWIIAWIDDQEYFRQEREHHSFSTRIEVYPSQPLGYATFQSKVVLKDFRWRLLKEPHEGVDEKAVAKPDELSTSADETAEVKDPL